MVEDTQKWKLLGIASNIFNDECDPKDFTVYSDITKLYSWIVSNSELFVCKNKKRIPVFKVCDGNKDCEGGTDEKFCGKEKFS